METLPVQGPISMTTILVLVIALMPTAQCQPRPQEFFFDIYESLKWDFPSTDDCKNRLGAIDVRHEKIRMEVNEFF